jgi:hypothetical protein
MRTDVCLPRFALLETNVCLPRLALLEDASSPQSRHTPRRRGIQAFGDQLSTLTGLLLDRRSKKIGDDARSLYTTFLSKAHHQKPGYPAFAGYDELAFSGQIAPNEKSEFSVLISRWLNVARRLMLPCCALIEDS